MAGIGERIKSVRGPLSRDKFSTLTGISKTALVNYETEDRTPSADYLAKILEAYPDISPAWLLIGEGEMKRGASSLTPARASGEVMSEKFKSIRGDRSIKNFVGRMYGGGSIRAEEQERLEVEIQAIEDNKKQPDWTLIACVCREYGISPSWIIEDEGPMLKKDIYLEYVLNADMLRQILMEADVYEAVNPGSLLPDKKSQLIAELYQMRMKKTQ